jgi:hypothetical protein
LPQETCPIGGHDYRCFDPGAIDLLLIRDVALERASAGNAKETKKTF